MCCGWESWDSKATMQGFRKSMCCSSDTPAIIYLYSWHEHKYIHKYMTFYPNILSPILRSWFIAIFGNSLNHAWHKPAIQSLCPPQGVLNTLQLCFHTSLMKSELDTGQRQLLNAMVRGSRVELSWRQLVERWVSPFREVTRLSKSQVSLFWFHAN